MAFTSLSERLQRVMQKLKGQAKLSENDVKDALREVRLALLEADVNFKVARQFVKAVEEKAVGHEVMSSLTPGQQVIKIVRNELAALMGGENVRLEMASSPPTVIMLVGLQGSGKTTSAAKLAAHLKKNGKKPMLVGVDVYRPAALEQLKVLAEQVGVTIYDPGTSDYKPVQLAQKAVQTASDSGKDVVIIDTAGRLHIDDELMDELQQLKKTTQPQHILLVVDAMTGQDAVAVAEGFHQQLDLEGIILTKLDGDTRGGAALSVRAATGCPIMFAGTGEKVDALEPFHPDRMAERILGMGDVLTLIEKAQESFDSEQAERLQNKMRSAELDLDDFLEQLQQFKNMGPLDEIVGMIPGMEKMNRQFKGTLQVSDKDLVHTEAIIKSMTPWERQNPDKIDGSRRRRIAYGSGTTIQDINRLLKQFEQTKKLMKQFGNIGGKTKKGGKTKFPKLPFM